MTTQTMKMKKEEAIALINKIHDLTLPELAEGITRVETANSEYKDYFLTVHFKGMFILRSMKMLNINRHTFRCNQKRYRTELYINKTIPGDMCLLISVKDSKDLDSMYARLYDEHKDTLLELLNKRETKTLSSNEFNFTPTFVNQYSEMEAF